MLPVVYVHQANQNTSLEEDITYASSAIRALRPSSVGGVSRVQGAAMQPCKEGYLFNNTWWFAEKN